jgi:ACS family hexuronate transporter-like MFS transporter
MLRWTAVVLISLAVVINYIDRQALSVLSPTILKEFGLNASQYGWVVFWFSMAYMTGAPLAGRVLDRIGVRFGLALAVASWSAVAGAHMFATGFFSLCALRVALGLTEAAIFPAGIKGASRILPVTERATGLGIVFAGSATGASLAPLLVVPLSTALDWRWTFLIMGGIGFVWILPWWWLTARTGTESLRPDSAAAGHAAQTIGALWKSPKLWAFLAGVFLVALPIGFGFFWLSLFLVKGRGLTLIEASKLQWIPYFASHTGTIGLGWLSGWLIGRGWPVLAARRKIILAASVLPLGQFVIPVTDNIGIVIAALTLAGVTHGGLYTLYYAYITDNFPPQQAGLLTGLGTMAYSLCASISGPLIGRIIDHYSWTPVILACAVSPAIGAVIWWWLGARRPLTHETQ